MKITHPFHPFHGQRLEVLKTRRVGCEDSFILRRPSGGTFPVARDWTDRADPTISELLGRPIVHDFDRLHSLAGLVKDLEDAARGSSCVLENIHGEKPTATP